MEIKKYLRLGVVPTKGRSINFRKMPLWRSSDFAWELENMGADIAYYNVDEKYLEAGISVFELDENGTPILDTEDLKNSYEYRIERGDEQFILEGIEVGRGYDGDPLIKLVV